MSQMSVNDISNNQFHDVTGLFVPGNLKLGQDTKGKGREEVVGRVSCNC